MVKYVIEVVRSSDGVHIHAYRDGLTRGFIDEAEFCNDEVDAAIGFLVKLIVELLGD